MRAVAVFLILSLSIPFPLLPAARAETGRPVETYDQLLSAVRQTMAESRQRIEEAVEREKVRESWEIGKLIDEHVLHHKERADYGEYVIMRLAGDLGTDRSELYRMLEFARTYPIVVPARQLSWSHYQALLAVNDPEVREAVAERAEKENWSRGDLRREIERLRRPETELPPPRPLEAEPGEVGNYRVVRAEHGPYEGELVIDLGFSTYFHREKPFKFKEGDIVSLVGATHASSLLKKVTSATEADLFTYPVSIIEVLDGDTFTAHVDLGFGVTTLQTLRLRGLDAREIESAEGREAKEYLEKALAAKAVKIRTVRSDKYDRYLVDVFVGKRYVNQELVEQGLATVAEEK